MSEREIPQEVVDAWKAENMKGLLAPDAEPEPGKQYGVLSLNAEQQNYNAGGGYVSFENGMLVELDSGGNPVNEALKAAMQEYPEEYTIE